MMHATDSKTAMPRVVIVGGGFAGIRAAKALRRAPVHVTVIDRSNHHTFQPLLYQVATAGLSPADISAPIRSVVGRQANTEVLLAEVTGVDLKARTVHVNDLAGNRDRAIPYDYLVLATGASESYFGHDEWREFAPGLKSIEDATAIRRKILLAFEAAETEADMDAEREKALLTFVVVGGGPTGVELAGAIAEIARKALVRDFRHINPASARILLVEASPRLLGAFPEKLARRAEEKLRQLGVEVKTNMRVERVDAGGVQMNGDFLAAGTVIWAAGVQASPAGQWLGAETDRAGRVLVERDLSVPAHPEVFVLGDTASVKGLEKPLPGLAPVALQQGAYIARTIQARLAGREAPPFVYFDKGTLSTVGRAFAIADIRGFQLSGFFAWVTWMAVHIFFLIGFRNRFLVMFQWAWAYLTYQRGSRLITNVEPELQPRPQMAGGEPTSKDPAARPASRAVRPNTPIRVAARAAETKR
jgi:NADH:ubiquinone reductase (H+-translocating)